MPVRNSFFLGNSVLAFQTLGSKATLELFASFAVAVDRSPHHPFTLNRCAAAWLYYKAQPAGLQLSVKSSLHSKRFVLIRREKGPLDSRAWEPHNEG